MRPVFADPKTDFVFKRIFGSEVHKPLLIELLNAIAGELDLYDRAKIAEQDARGALSLAERLGREEGRAEGREEGHAEGLAEGLREAIRALCQALAIELDEEREAMLADLTAAELKELQ